VIEKPCGNWRPVKIGRDWSLPDDLIDSSPSPALVANSFRRAQAEAHDVRARGTNPYFRPKSKYVRKGTVTDTQMLLEWGCLGNTNTSGPSASFSLMGLAI
jgi:hypothetical protein